MDRSSAPRPRGDPLTAGGLLDRLSAGGPSLVALSGGVDSAVVALLAHRAFPGKSRAATLIGPAVSQHEVERATEVARWVGIPHALVAVDPLKVEGYRSNMLNRCYFCRSTESAALKAHGSAFGITRYLDGVHRDDLGEDRPGIRALDEAGFEHPLLEADWGKREVREWARAEGLPNWDAPSDACLASRIPHGTPVDAALLERIAASEGDVRALGYRRIRVRVEGPGARVEVDPTEVERLLRPAESAEVIRLLVARGFHPVRLDPRGYGSRADA